MIKCQFCQTVHVDNTIFCSECGYYLLENTGRETDPLDTVEMREEENRTVNGLAGSLQRGGESLAIRLKIGPRQREVEMPLNVITHLGRVDASASVFPEVDLSDDSDASHGVSRRHARILKQGGMVVVEDMGSINGTFVNGKRLDPYLPEVLNDGDVLQLGKLKIEVKIRKR
ncbi:MAG: FHA domain-containing protein [Anaerolineae bacterium]|nr:FHA domain-containing protein [Anaerolineae bacterium]